MTCGQTQTVVPSECWTPRCTRVLQTLLLVGKHAGKWILEDETHPVNQILNYHEPPSWNAAKDPGGRRTSSTLAIGKGSDKTWNICFFWSLFPWLEGNSKHLVSQWLSLSAINFCCGWQGPLGDSAFSVICCMIFESFTTTLQRTRQPALKTYCSVDVVEARCSCKRKNSSGKLMVKPRLRKRSE